MLFSQVKDLAQQIRALQPPNNPNGGMYKTDDKENEAKKSCKNSAVDVNSPEVRVPVEQNFRKTITSKESSSSKVFVHSGKKDTDAVTCHGYEVRKFFDKSVTTEKSPEVFVLKSGDHLTYNTIIHEGGKEDQK